MSDELIDTLFRDFEVSGPKKQGDRPDQRNAQQQQVQALRSALNVSNLRYQGGITSYVDVLLAKRTLFDAEFQLAAIHRFHLGSIVQLYKALGGGWAPV